MSALRPLLAIAALTFCPPLLAETRIYDVDPAYRQEVYAVLMRLLDSPGDQSRAGKVEVLPNGQLVVDTVSEGRQDEVAAILESIARNRPAETPSVSLRYWLLGTDSEVGTSPPPILSSVVSELAEVHGPQTFRVLGSATVTGRTGQQTYFESAPWIITQIANVSGERLNAALYVEHNLMAALAASRQQGQQEFISNMAKRTLRVEVSFTPGQFLVLGSGMTPGTEEGGVTAIVVQWPGAE
jgi:hypothetical protein